MLKNYTYLTKLLIKNDIKRKYRNSVLGVLWSLLSPLLEMVVLTIIFSAFLSKNINNFPVYLLSGRLLFGFFASSTSMAMQTIVNAAALIKKINVPKYIMIISKVLSNFIIFLISLLALVIVMLITGTPFSVNLFYAPLYLLALLVFSIGVGFILATIYVYFRDTEYLYSVFLTILMYASAIFYPLSIVPEKYSWLLKMNPLVYFISGFRNVVYKANSIDWNNFGICMGIAVVFLVIGFTIFSLKQDKFVFYV